MIYNPVDGNYLTRKFKQIFTDTDQFRDEFKASDLGTYNTTQVLTDEELGILYALLYARYGNSTIASNDENQFKYNVFSTIFIYGPTWAKKLNIQDGLRKLTIDELQAGSKAIYNTALNPGTTPSPQALEELNFINSQNTTNYKKSKAEAWAMLLSLLETDVTEEFINKFKKLFITIVQPDYPLWYVTTPEEQEILGE